MLQYNIVIKSLVY